MLKKAKWIWSTPTSVRNQRANFFFDAELAHVPEAAELLIGCETKYWLFVNEKLVVFEGGLFRESAPGCGYYDRVDIASYLNEGKNRITLHVWYYGNGGRNNSFFDRAGLILSSEPFSISPEKYHD